MINLNQAETLIMDMNMEARIAEYDCACRLRLGDIEGAKQRAEEANLFRQASLKIAERILNDETK